MPFAFTFDQSTDGPSSGYQRLFLCARLPVFKKDGQGFGGGHSWKKCLQERLLLLLSLEECLQEQLLLLLSLEKCLQGGGGGGLGVSVAVVVAAGTEEAAAVVVVPGEVS